jgi:hypothetical protein
VRDTDSATEREPLFLAADLPELDFGLRDEVFLRHGFSRGKLELRGLSRLFNPVKPECTLLRLRSLFGISARAEIILYLLTHAAGHPSHIARETGYSQKNVQDTMLDLSASGMIQPCLPDGRRKSYFIAPDDRTAFLPVNRQPPRWVSWPPFFRALKILIQTTATLEEGSVSESVLASEMRHIMAAVRPHVEAAGFADALTDPRPHTGEAYLQVFRHDTNRLLLRVHA